MVQTRCRNLVRHYGFEARPIAFCEDGHGKYGRTGHSSVRRTQSRPSGVAGSIGSAVILERLLGNMPSSPQSIRTCWNSEAAATAAGLTTTVSRAATTKPRVRCLLARPSP
jgi:hypothetical protein